MISSNKRIVGVISVGFLRVKSNVESISGLLFLEMYMILLLFSWIFIPMLSVILCLLYVKVLLYEELSSVRRSAMGVWYFIGKQHLPLWEFLHKFSLQALSFFLFFFLVEAYLIVSVVLLGRCCWGTEWSLTCPQSHSKSVTEPRIGYYHQIQHQGLFLSFVCGYLHFHDAVIFFFFPKIGILDSKFEGLYNLHW